MSKTVLPPSASVFLKTVDRSGEKISQLPVKLNTLWNADECPEVLLPWLAWTLSVDRWDKAWTEETRRDVIRESWMVHRHKGTISAMRRAIAPFGALLSITEWWENGCPELCPLFCDVDDVTYGGLHKLGFSRTKTLGGGGDCCDFRFFKR